MPHNDRAHHSVLTSCLNLVSLLYSPRLVRVTVPKVGKTEQKRLIEPKKERVIRLNSLNHRIKWFYHPKHSSQALIFIKQTRSRDIQTVEVAVHKETVQLDEETFRRHRANSVR